MHKNSLENLKLGQKRKEGGARTTVILSGAARQAAQRIGGGKMAVGIERSLKAYEKQRAALLAVAHDNGFFNPYWGQDLEEVLDSVGDFDAGDRQVPSPAVSTEVIAWANWWVKLKEWDLLVSSRDKAPYPDEKMEQQHKVFIALDAEAKEQAKDIGNEKFAWKHPGWTGQDALPSFPAAVILACWEDEA